LIDDAPRFGAHVGEELGHRPSDVAIPRVRTELGQKLVERGLELGGRRMASRNATP
jgi:hypothetical protein